MYDPALLSPTYTYLASLGPDVPRRVALALTKCNDIPIFSDVLLHESAEFRRGAEVTAFDLYQEEPCVCNFFRAALTLEDFTTALVELKAQIDQLEANSGEKKDEPAEDENELEVVDAFESGGLRGFVLRLLGAKPQKDETPAPIKRLSMVTTSLQAFLAAPCCRRRLREEALPTGKESAPVDEATESPAPTASTEPDWDGPGAA